ncbi:MAG: 23S rRNA (uracil(1939)-C(5))-methyltransferase RlmD [Candidatus Schekmanbacteria bacterium]|nr:23S rRNA (uracil(1939)-C(5))-methyltransferase RlmD [Candidatus Schekmanbacteria bacterium]
MIPFGITEETVKAEIVETKKDYLIAKITGFVKASPERITPPCTYFPDCGGCDYQHVTYRGQLMMKMAIIKDMLKRVGKIEKPFVNPIIPSPDPFNYRTRVELKVSKKRQKNDAFLGFYKKNSHNIVQIEKCLICHPKINEVIEAINYFCGNDINKHTEKIKIALCAVSSKMILTLKGEKFPKNMIDRLGADLKKYVKGVEGIVIEEPRRVAINGKDYFNESIGELKYRVNSNSFFQINHLLREDLVRLILRLCSPKKTDFFADIYSGVGTFSIPLAQKVNEVICIEDNENAVKDAQANIRAHKLKNISYVKGDAGNALKAVFEDNDKISGVLLNPPRSGCTNDVKSRIAKAMVNKIIYLSCDPATLSRDISFFVNNGYQIDEIQPIDLFPQSYHIETAIKLSRAQ